MILTGKCKEDFDKWFELEYSHCAIYDYWINEDLGISIQYGVFVDFFDSVDIYVETYYAAKNTYEVIVNEIGYELCDTRQEAREQAILKANEIYNENT